jgi:hypothetical protein
MSTFRTNGGLRRAAGVVVLGALVLGGTFATAAAFSGRGSSSDEDLASPAPSRVPVVTPAPVATHVPTDGGDDAMPITVDIETADGHDVHVDIVDRYGLLESAKSGHPAEGMSVEPYTLEIENLDERTLKLTWVDFGINNALALHFFQEGKVLVMVQPEPDGDVDAMGHDRALILTFDEPIHADDIEGFLQGGLDTPGDDAAQLLPL